MTAPVTPAADGGENAETAPTAPTAPTAATTVEQLPEFAQTMIKDLRAEAAKHRTSKGEAVETAKAETTAALKAEYDAKLADAQAAVDTEKTGQTKLELEVAKLKTFLGVVDGDPAKEDGLRAKAELFAGLLTGTTVEEITTQAEALKAFSGGTVFSTKATDPSPEGRPLALNNDDGLLGALKRAVGAE